METNQKFKVVLLPSDKAIFHGIIKNGNILKQCYERNGISSPYDKDWIGQHLYIISNDEIKEGDWYYNPNTLNKYHIFQRSELGNEFVNNHKDADSLKNLKKIVATTDPFARTIIGNKIPESFIQSYIKSYNEGKVIEEVELEMIEQIADGTSYGMSDPMDEPPTEFVIKTNSSNEVIIKSVEDSWNNILYTHKTEEIDWDIDTFIKYLNNNYNAPTKK